MKNLSVILNVVLLIAVIVLFYLHFSSNKTTGGVTADEASDSTSAAAKLPVNVLKEGRVYFVNLDSLNTKYLMIADLSKKLNARMGALEADYQGKMQKFEQEAMAYQQRLQENSITVDEARVVEDNLKKQRDKIAALEASMENLGAERDKNQEELQKELDAFMAEYTKGKKVDYILSSSSFVRTILYGNDSLDITNEVVNGLNERYKQKNATKK